jgi:SpoVK/Ycf46/Vps4 family AAA+-type ATPase
MGPIREIAQQRRGNLKHIATRDVPPITVAHFLAAFESVMPSVSPSDLQRYIDWNTTYGSYRKMS